MAAGLDVSITRTRLAPTLVVAAVEQAAGATAAAYCSSSNGFEKTEILHFAELARRNSLQANELAAGPPARNRHDGLITDNEELRQLDELRGQAAQRRRRRRRTDSSTSSSKMLSIGRDPAGPRRP